jgi:hypothetical protein
VPNTRAAPGSAQRSEIVSDAVRPSARPSSSPASASAPLANSDLGERDHVDPEVEHRAAAEGGGEEPIGGVERPPDPEVGLHRADLPDRAVGDQVPQSDDGGLEARPHRLHDEPAGGPGEIDDLGGSLRGRGERLLDQECLARPQPGHRHGVVLGMRGRDVEDVDVGVGDELGVGAVGALQSVPPGEVGRAVGRPGADGEGLRAVDHREVLHDVLGDAAGPDDAPAEISHVADRSGAADWPHDGADRQPGLAVAGPAVVAPGQRRLLRGAARVRRGGARDPPAGVPG